MNGTDFSFFSFFFFLKFKTKVEISPTVLEVPVAEPQILVICT